MKIMFDGSLRGQLQLEVDRGAANILASKVLRKPVEEFGADESEAVLRLLEAGMIELQTAAVEEYGTFTVKASSASEPVSDDAQSEQITVADNDSNRVSILISLNPSLVDALTIQAQIGRTAAVMASSMKAAAVNSISEQANLNLVMDVELNVTLRFGRRQLTLREVLELTSGSVVELDRQVEEPVELLLDSKVIARGEAVVIDGNYGLRVTEVCQQILSPAIR
jgi:flagellar motor switch protein FliN/FliY